MTNLDYCFNHFEAIIRRFTSLIRLKTSDKGYYKFTSILKRLRCLFSKPQVISKHPQSSDFCIGISRESKFLRLCITHDIDSIDCADLLGEVLAVGKNFGALPTVNFLTSGSYELTSSHFDQVLGVGGEVGLHGDFHDLYLCCRPADEIQIRLKKMMDRFPKELRPTSFRHPGFGMSHNLALTLSEFGFTRDASLKGGAFFNKSFFGYEPFYLPMSNVLEVRTHLSDDGMIREHKLDTTQQLNLTIQTAREVAKYGGVMNMNFHPGIIGKNLPAYELLLDSLMNDFEVEFSTLGNLKVTDGI
jgi:hypothetical protein